MHHSSIREHLSKIHPDCAHNSNCPGYVYNASAVPNPEDFNSTSFDKEAFINEAKQNNDKLSAQLNSVIQLSHTSPTQFQHNGFNVHLDTPVSISPTSSNDNPQDNDVGIKKRKKKVSSKRMPKKETCTDLDGSLISNKSNETTVITTPKPLNPFSIDSIINTPTTTTKSSQNQMPLNYNGCANMYSQWNAAAWLYANQMMFKMMSTYVSNVQKN